MWKAKISYLPTVGFYITTGVPRLLGLLDHHQSTDVPTDSHTSDGELTNSPLLPSNTDPYISYRSFVLAIYPD